MTSYGRRRFGCAAAILLVTAVLLIAVLLPGPCHPWKGTWRLDVADLREQILALRARSPSTDAGETLGDPRLAGVRLGDVTGTALDESLATRHLVLRILPGLESWDVEMEESLPTGVRVRSFGGISSGPTLRFCSRVPEVDGLPDAQGFEVRDGVLLLPRGPLTLRLRRE